MRKSKGAFVLFDDHGVEVARSQSLDELLAQVEAIPGLASDAPR
ncbi:MAG: hypothetical protein AAF767_01665 [Pseudomonadota bacterium]